MERLFHTSDVDRYESRTPAELLAFHFVTEARIHSSIDECVPNHPGRQLLTRLKHANENEGEEERDERKRSELIRLKHAEKRRADETAKELRASPPITIFSHAISSQSDDERQVWLMLATLLIRWCYVCSVQSGSPKMVTTMIRRVITERLNEIGAVRRKTVIFIRTNDLGLITTLSSCSVCSDQEDTT